MVGHNLRQLRLHELRVPRLPAQPAQHLRRTLELPALDKVPRGLRQEEQPRAQDEGPQHLQRDGDAVGAAVGVVLGAVVDAGGEQQADRDAELVARHDRAAHLLRRDLGHVQDDDGGDEADAEARDQPPGHEQAQRGGGGLQDDADDEDEAAEDDGGAAAGEVRQVAGDDGAEEGARGQDGDDEGLLPRGDGEAVGARGGVLGELGVVGVEAGVEVDEVGHPRHAVDVARVVAKVDAAKGREGAHQVGLDRDGRLDARRVGRGHQSSSASRHVEDEVAVLLRVVVREVGGMRIWRGKRSHGQLQGCFCLLEEFLLFASGAVFEL